ncbi:putative metal-dependent glycoprotease [Mycolicibacterium canariasense]|uniref:Putative metal-dependent glycoprotease n=1 Tax=Mycolicibacterium canariasense TaxID=228230 RepID=A0A100WHJ5_MYCCR|nr:amidohydrolase [Mycolicibacterium canariasense]MCV7210090.1 amidohydrolase [Mycolicibacterium canariasense]ORV13398.1 amidohydrolase [Mycolicibacterium canariasense]GAS98412.1 putative metal-dependent glycoprotease [Mycolicibacterium canariasense]
MSAAQRVLITGGHVFTPAGIVEEPVLIDDGVITAIGAEALTGSGAVEIDAAGGLVSPGFQDSHIHPYHAGLDMIACDLTPYTTADGYLTRIAEYAAANPELTWISGGGWSMDSFPGGLPTAAALDAVVPDRPAYFPNRDGHGAWVNTRALEIAGIDDATPDPFDGRIERDAGGHAIGTLQEGAMALVARHIPLPSQDDLDEALKIAQQRLFGWGVTAWQDAIVGATNDTPDSLDSYLRATASGMLKAHVVGALWWDRNRGLEQIPELVAKRERALAGGFSATTVKIMQDGVAENFTAGMLEPYLDACGCPGENMGKSFVDPTTLKQISTELDALGFQLHFHALGDRAVRESLDAIEAARTANGDNDLRHTLAHIQVVHPADVPRFAELGVVANMQPLWARHEDQMDLLTVPFLGRRRAAWQYPFGSLQRAGAALASGSDWPVSTANPLEIIHTSVNRAPVGATGPSSLPFLGEQALSLADALIAHSLGTAYLNHDEHRSGTIEVGKSADIVILDRDIFAAPVAEIGSASVAYTLIGGEVVYEADSVPVSA